MDGRTRDGLLTGGTRASAATTPPGPEGQGLLGARAVRAGRLAGRAAVPKRVAAAGAAVGSRLGGRDRRRLRDRRRPPWPGRDGVRRVPGVGRASPRRRG